MAVSELDIEAEKRRFFLPESKLQDLIDVEGNLGDNSEHGVMDACLDPEKDFDDKFKHNLFPENCALGVINLGAGIISMDVEDESIICVACLPGYTPEYFEASFLIIESCVEMTHCKKATLWVNGCDEP